MKQSRQRHHYIPEFYLKQWANPQGKYKGQVYEFCKRYKGILPRPTFPAGTGYVENLYTLSGFPPDKSQIMENQFFKITDQLANDALQILLDDKVSNLSIDLMSGWSRFILSLIHRNPEKIAWIRTKIANELNISSKEMKENYEKIRRPQDPATVEEYVENPSNNSREVAFGMLLKAMVDSDTIGNYLNRMKWSIIFVKNPSYPLLTSDRPVVMSDGIKYDHSYIIVPISSTALFLAVNTQETERKIQEIPIQDLIKTVNHTVVSQAVKFVYGSDERQLCFIRNRLGRKPAQFIGADRRS